MYTYPSNPYQYPTYQDLTTLVPSLANNAQVSTLFTSFQAAASVYVDPNFAKQYTNVLSLYLVLHFITLFFKGITSATFDPFNFFTVSAGPAQEIEAERVKTKFAEFKSNSNDLDWEANLNRTVWGQLYLQTVYMVRKLFGVDGNGNLWSPL